MLRKIGVAMAIVGIGICISLLGILPEFEHISSQDFQHVISLALIGCGILAFADILSANQVSPWAMVAQVFDRAAGVSAPIFLVWVASLVAREGQSFLGGVFVLISVLILVIAVGGIKAVKHQVIPAS